MLIEKAGEEIRRAFFSVLDDWKSFQVRSAEAWVMQENKGGHRPVAVGTESTLVRRLARWRENRVRGF